MKSLLPLPSIDNDVIFQIVYVGRDDAIVEKFWESQELMSLSFLH